MKPALRWVLFATVMAFWWSVAVIPGVRRAQELPALIRETERRSERQRRENNRQLDSDREREKLETDLGKLLYVTRESEHYERLLREIHNISSESGVRLLGIQPRSADNVGEFRRFPMEVDAEGDLEGIIRLLLALRDLRPRADIGRVSLRTSGEPNRIDIQVTIASLAWSPKREGSMQAAAGESRARSSDLGDSGERL